MKKQSSIPEVPATMNAIRLHTATGPQGLAYEQVPTPLPGAGEVLVRVYAAAITRDELDWPVNRLPAIPSYEFSGVVAAVRPDSTGIEVGEAVYSLSPFNRNGAAADFIALPANEVAPKPTTLGYVESAAVPLAALSAWQGLFDHGSLVKGQRVLIHGATGGVGGFAVQLAHQRGATVIGTTSTRNVEAARALGADEVIDYTLTHFEEDIDKVDLVFDTAGGDRLARSPSVIRPGGRLVSIASEPSQEQAARFGIIATYFVVAPDRGQLVELAKLVDAGSLRPTIAAVYPLAEARKAFERCQAGGNSGKIVLRVAAG